MATIAAGKRLAGKVAIVTGKTARPFIQQREGEDV